LYTKALSYLVPESLLNPINATVEASKEVPTKDQETQKHLKRTDKPETTVLETQTSKETSTHKETQEPETTQEEGTDKEPSEKNISETPTSKETSTPTIKELIKGPFQSYCATYLANRAAAYLALEDWDNTIKDANTVTLSFAYCLLILQKVLQLDPKHTKALLRRAKAYEMKDKLEEALKGNSTTNSFLTRVDYQEVVKLDPSIKAAVEATRSLPPKIEQQREKLKQEAIGEFIFGCN
jgi:hypothetical protein